MLMGSGTESFPGTGNKDELDRGIVGLANKMGKRTSEVFYYLMILVN